MTTAIRRTLYAAAALAALALTAALALAWLWRDRPSLAELPWPIAETLQDTAVGSDKSVSVTWLGIATLVFDDGETQIMVDGAITRLSVADIALQRRVRSDVATVNFAMDEYRLNRLAAIVAGHSHFDHAIDIGQIANRSRAVVLGSESIANIARGAGVPVDQYQTLASGETRVFGDFAITFIESRHVPIGPGGEGWFAGVIDEPLPQPARAWSWRGGAVGAILLEHPQGTALIKSSAGFVEGELGGRTADVALLSVAGLKPFGAQYAHQYWEETVGASSARQVFAIHYDDFTRPFGEVALFPTIVDDVVTTSEWMNSVAAEADITIKRLPFGIPVTLY